MTQHTETAGLVYAGFWIRVWASIIDSVLVMFIVAPLLSMVYGARVFAADGPLIMGPAHVLISYVLPGVAVLAFWIYRQATPGKMAIGARIVDARTGAHPGSGQFIVRYLGYFLSSIPLGMGLIWVGVDRRKQGWHDKLAGTVVIRAHSDTAPVRFEEDRTRSERTTDDGRWQA